ncbi:methionyl-tRNA formyltransferase [Fodinicurvata sediminis]|uniref:methionyl-tRNA formyltransferase n=1 Tax=Fodinicurvata sediminis TaxID=1121832 RepID=UPI0003FB7D87|nr:methionyl-tRNA formyltransferase [Fodinicurvata sediminis]
MSESTTTSRKKPLRLAFMGTPDFAVPTLEALIWAGHEIVAVYTQPPRPAGRGHRETRSPVHDTALAHDLPVHTPDSLKDPQAQADFAALDLDVAVVVAYGQILPQAVLDAPRHGCVNVHASLLPRWRGAAPIQRALLAGDAETGVTLMRMEAGLDTGPMLARLPLEIAPDETGQSLHDRLARQGAEAIASVLADYVAGRITPEPQPEEGVTYAAKLTRAESALDWRRPAVELERKVRAFTPWPGAYCEFDGARIKVVQAALQEGQSGARPGTVLDDRLTVACGEGALRLVKLQRPGRSVLEASAFLRGFAVPAGAVLSLPEPA